ncbi:MAG TPA: ComEC/Rec2 family competence protein [Chlamydiales bacterium]|nr:ComEC/Rec2 family competence protein [Chlamydiales bacterium]
MKSWLRQYTRNDSHLQFWKEHPALLASLAILIGTSSALFFEHYFWSCIFACYLVFCRASMQIILLVFSIFYGHLHKIPELPKEITGIFTPHILLPHSTPFHQELQYKGYLNEIPCTIYFRGNKEQRPLANKKYLVQGELQERGKADFVLKTKEWKEHSSFFTFAEQRYLTKEKFKRFLYKNLSLPSAKFLSSITTGDVEDRSLRYEFSRVGLQHILAISGFHFGILIAFLTYFLGLIFTRTWKILSLFLLTTAYYIFVGSTPAVERSYLTALFYLLGMWTHRNTSGLNLLGMALGIEILFNPHISSNLGFQLSFLSCFAILLFYSPIEQWMRKFLLKRSWSEIQNLTLLSRHGYLLSSFFRKALSLNLAVNIALLPLILYHFQQFPFLGLIYNLFFPFCIGGSLFLLLVALLFQLLFYPLAKPIFWFTSLWTDFLLSLVYNPPLAIDFSLRFSYVPVSFIMSYLCILGYFKISKSHNSPI